MCNIKAGQEKCKLGLTMGSVFALRVQLFDMYAACVIVSSFGPLCLDMFGLCYKTF